MSISLPNGTILATPSSQPQLSAAVTRILHLSKFSADLKTRDLQLIFKEWENEKGGFRIKWLDDVNALVVFADASVAKRAYLSLLLNPPPNFSPPSTIRPYDRPDAAQIIQSLAARAMGHRASMSSALTSGGLGNLPAPEVHSRTTSISNPNSGLNGFSMPIKAPVAINPLMRNTNAPSQRMNLHSRTGSASSSWGRQAGAGVLNFSMPSSSSAGRMPTHTESSSTDPMGSSDATGSGDSAVTESNASTWRMGSRGSLSVSGAGGEQKPRRESMSADKALREVEKALASVETQA